MGAALIWQSVPTKQSVAQNYIQRKTSEEKNISGTRGEEMIEKSFFKGKEDVWQGEI